MSRDSLKGNLGIILDSSLNLDAYISKLSKAAFFQLWRIAKLRSFMSPKDAESLVHAFITSRLDYCNALFFWITSTLHLPIAIYSKLCYKNVNVYQTVCTLLILLLFFSTSIGYPSPLVSFIKFFCLPWSHFTVLHLLISLTYFLHILLLVCFDHLEENLFLFLDLAFHLWEGDLSLLWLLNLGTHCPCVSGQKPHFMNLSPNSKRICSTNIIGHHYLFLKLLWFNAVSDCLLYLTLFATATACPGRGKCLLSIYGHICVIS